MQALIAGEKSLSSAATISRYRLGSSANVNRARKSLIEKEILDDSSGARELSFQDPIYRYWLEYIYFQ